VRHGQQIDGHPAGGVLAFMLQQMLEHPSVGFAGEQAIAIDQPHKRHRLAPQRVDHMPVIDDMTMLAIVASAAAHQGHEQRAAQEQIDPVIIEPRAQAVSD